MHHTANKTSMFKRVLSGPAKVRGHEPADLGTAFGLDSALAPPPGHVPPADFGRIVPRSFWSRVFGRR